MQSQKQTKGFTLIELMIVTAVLGILAAIIIPPISKLVACSKGKNSIACQKFIDRNRAEQGMPAQREDEVITVNGVQYRRIN